jgi:hypothetical protein
MRAGASPQVALPLLSPFEHGTDGTHGTSRDGHAPENARTDSHGMGYVCRYTPTARLVLRAAVTAEYLDGAIRRATRRKTRVEVASNPGVS